MTDAPQFPRAHLTARNEQVGKVWGWVFIWVIAVMVLIIGSAGWMLFAELTRCDPCEWVGLSAPLIGDW